MMKGKMKTDAGNMAFYGVVIALVLMIFFCGVWEYLRIFAILGQVDKAVISSVEGVAQDNWDEIYQGVREGYAGAYTKKELIDAWTVVMNRKRITAQLKEMIDLKEDGLLLSKIEDDGSTIFSIEPDAMEINIINTEFGDEERNSLVVEAVNEVIVPWMFLGNTLELPPITFTRTTRVHYVPKF